MVTDPRRLDPLRTMWAILLELARQYPVDFATTSGFGRWLDGGEWDAGKIAETNTGDVLAEAMRQCSEYDRGMAPHRLYRP
jgi:hypothetical protein